METPFPAEQLAVLERDVRHYRRLPEADRKRLRDLVQVFIAEKHWEGCGGLQLTDAMKFIIAAQACQLVLELPHRLYENVESILVYPSTVLRPARRLRIFEAAGTIVSDEATALLGEAHAHGTVVLAWDRVLREAHAGHNLVYHEFAHQLDLLDGHADGTPPLASEAERQRWHDVCERAFLRLRAQTERSEPTALDSYGATNEAEFFAVATEHFFDRPLELQRAEPELYQVLWAFYRQDPAALEARE